MPGQYLVDVTVIGISFVVFIYVFFFLNAAQQSYISVVQFDSQGSNMYVLQVVLPTFILEKRSLLETYAEFLHIRSCL